MDGDNIVWGSVENADIIWGSAARVYSAYFGGF
jgi:hypothetical protein